MRNIIIGLCAALVLYGAQAFGCGHDGCIEYYTGGTIDGAPVWNPVYRTPCTESFKRDITTSRDFDLTGDDRLQRMFEKSSIGSLLEEFSGRIEFQPGKVAELSLFQQMFQQIASKATKILKLPELPPLEFYKIESLYKPQSFDFGTSLACFTKLKIEPGNLYMETEQKERVSRYYNAPVGKEKRKAKKLTKLPKHARMKAREAKFAARNFGHDSD